MLLWLIVEIHGFAEDLVDFEFGCNLVRDFDNHVAVPQ